MEKHQGRRPDSEAQSCPGRIKVPTEKELEALSALKSIKERRRRLKQRLSELKGKQGTDASQEMEALVEEMGHLKQDWERWTRKRDEAARERMILLGHEEP